MQQPPATLPTATDAPPPTAEPVPSASLASPWQRLLAFLVNVAAYSIVFIASLSIGIPASEADTEGVAAVIIILMHIGYVIPQLYLVSIRGQDLGKIVVKIRIVREDGRPFGWRGMLMREFMCKVLFLIIPYVNVVWLLTFVWILFDAKQQGWHDKVAETRVVRLPAPDHLPQSR